MSETGYEENKHEIWPSFSLPPINLWNAPATQPAKVDNPLYEFGGIPIWHDDNDRLLQDSSQDTLSEEMERSSALSAD